MKRIFLALFALALTASVVYTATSWKVTDSEDSSLDGTEIVFLENGSGTGNNWTALSTIKSWLANYFALDSEVVKTSGAITVSTDISQFLGSTNYAAALGYLGQDDIQTSLGISLGAVNFGTFTGSTLTDSSTLKALLQELETAIEGKQAADADLTDLADGSIDLSKVKFTAVADCSTYTGAGVICLQIVP